VIGYLQTFIFHSQFKFSYKIKIEKSIFKFFKTGLRQDQDFSSNKRSARSHRILFEFKRKNYFLINNGDILTFEIDFENKIASLCINGKKEFSLQDFCLSDNEINKLVPFVGLYHSGNKITLID
jgi:hypothetical protein